jgi:hypothetical protein
MVQDGLISVSLLEGFPFFWPHHQDYKIYWMRTGIQAWSRTCCEHSCRSRALIQTSYPQRNWWVLTFEFSFCGCISHAARWIPCWMGR